MNASLFVVSLRAVFLLPFLASLAPAADPQAAVVAELQRCVASYRGRGQVALCVQDTANGELWFAHNADHPQRPASVMKLFVTASALDRFGPDFKFETRAYLIGDELWVVGGGDPALGDERLSRRDHQRQDAFFAEIAARLRDHGAATLSKIVLDDSVFDKQWRHPDWPSDQALAWYQAPVGGLNFNDNCLDAQVRLRAGRIDIQPFPDLPDEFINSCLKPGRKHAPRVTRGLDSDVFVFDGGLTHDDTLGPISAHRPDVFFGHALAQALASSGIELHSGVVRRDFPPDVLKTQQPLATQRTPLPDILWRCNCFSQNLFAECLEKSLAAYGPGGVRTGRPGSWDAGTQVLRETLAHLGVATDAADFRDGSGLSYKNRVTAAQIAQLLIIMSRHKDATVFMESLASPGEDGTLRKRLGPAFRGRIRAKTGTLKDVHGLAGYVWRDDGVTLTFALLIDGGDEGDLGRRVCTALLK